MRNRRILDVASGLAMAGSALLAYFAVNEWPARPDRSRHAALGQALAREALRHLQPGQPVIAITRDTEAFAHPESDAQWKGFQQAIREGGAEVTLAPSIQVDPLRNVEVPPGDFFEWLRKAPPGSVIVSFMGPPVLSPEQQARLGEVRPAVVAFCPGTVADRVDLRPLFEGGLLRGALVERRDGPVARPRGGASSPPEWCDANYRMVGAGDVAELYDAETGRRVR